MDSAEPPPPRTTNTAKNTSSISSLLRFSRLCKLGSSVAAGNPQKPTTDSPPSAAAAAASEEPDSGDRKIHPHPLDGGERLNLGEDAMISRVFAGVSALKSAYIQLQQAHVPYQPDEIRAADALVVSELRSLSELHAEVRSRSPLLFEIQDQQEFLEELQSKLQSKDSEARQLRWELEELDQKNAELEQEARERNLVSFLIDQELTPSAFAGVAKLAFDSIHGFAKPLISLMKASGWDLDAAANAIDGTVVYAERSHKKYAFEAFLSKVMLSVSDGNRFDMDQFDQVVSSGDPFDALLQYPHSDFGKFCRMKYAAAVHPKMEGSFFGNCDQRALVLRGGHPRTPFYQAFVKMARWVWALQVLAHSFIPKAEPFCVERGTLYAEESMESVVKMVAAAAAAADERLMVGLNVMPGFKIGRDVIRCRVYLCRTKPCSSVSFQI